MIAAPRIRALGHADVEVLAAILSRAYGSEQSVERLRTYLETPWIATFVAEIATQPVGMVVGNDYGSIAYAAQMAVEPSLQRRGIATALMDELIAWADRRAFPAVELDATPAGAPLYARYGFVEHGQTQVYLADEAGGDARAARPYAQTEREALLALDRRAFGADRRAALAPLLASETSAVVVSGPPDHLDGYAVVQLRTQMLGPVVAADAVIAAGLIDAARTRLRAGHRICIPTSTGGAQMILARRGYRLSRSLAHMIRGEPPPARQAVFARMSLGQG